MHKPVSQQIRQMVPDSLRWVNIQAKLVYMHVTRLIWANRTRLPQAYTVVEDKTVLYFSCLMDLILSIRLFSASVSESMGSFSGTTQSSDDDGFSLIWGRRGPRGKEKTKISRAL